LDAVAGRADDYDGVHARFSAEDAAGRSLEGSDAGGEGVADKTLQMRQLSSSLSQLVNYLPTP